MKDYYIDERIEYAEEKVIKTRRAYKKAVEELESLLRQKGQQIIEKYGDNGSNYESLSVENNNKKYTGSDY